MGKRKSASSKASSAAHPHQPSPAPGSRLPAPGSRLPAPAGRASADPAQLRSGLGLCGLGLGRAVTEGDLLPGIPDSNKSQPGSQSPCSD